MRALALTATLAAVFSVGCSTGNDNPGQGSGGGASGGNASSGTNASGGSAQAGSMSQGGSSSLPQAGTDSTSMSGSGPAGASNGGASSGGASGGVAPGCPTSTPMAPPMVTVCPAAAGATPPDTALTTVNDLRAHMGLACMTLVTEINTSAQKHCDYYQQNTADKACIANAHVEVATCAGYVAANFNERMTAAGYKGSPRSEVMAFSGNPTSAIAQWINSVYHRTPLLSPWIREMGYGMTADCDTIDMGLGTKTPDDATAVYPYPGQTGLPLSFDGSHEGPTPPAPPSGWPSASPVHLYVKSYTVTSHDVFVNGTCDPIAHQWLPDKDQYILYPDKPFAKATEYRVVIVGTKAGTPLTFDWTFTTK
jgi:Cysteine-rich secretory protein family